MSLKKILVVLLAFVMAFSCLTACSSTNPVAAPVESSEAPAEEPATEEPAAEEPVAEEPTYISYGTWKPEQLDFFSDPENMPEELKEKNIVVTIDYSPTDTYLSLLLADIAAGTAPDVPQMPVGTTLMAAAPYIIDLTEYADRDFGEGWKDNYLDCAFALIDTFGGVKAIPWGVVGMCCLQYNIDLFNELGLEAPTTIENMKTAATVLRENGYQPCMYGYNDNAAFVSLFRTFVNGLDATAWDKAEFTGEMAFTDDVFVKAAEIYKDLYDNGFFCDNFMTNNLYMDAVDPFTHGEAGMLMNGTWCANFVADPAYTSIIDFEVGMIELPDLDGDGDTTPIFASADFAACISDGCENPDAAWEVVKCLTVGSVGSKMLDTLTGAPCNDYQIDTSFATEEQLPKVEATVENLGNMMDRAISSYVGYGMTNADLFDAVLVGLADYVTGNKTVDEFLGSVEALAVDTRFIVGE